jgi:hypothetical protein
VAVGVIAGQSIQRDIRSGTATSRSWKCNVRRNPIGFWLIIAIRAVFVAFAIAEILYAFGLVSNPMLTVKHALSFLPET